ncbi:kinase-like protein [Colletotrichum tofieldiae]|nr:kinase-like protein [Colletotrichum tofieldiae]GKT73948.1 kinase-like protein [Colletotrichum tofieldiae]
MDEAANTLFPELSGLKWVRTLWGLEPRWVVEPDGIMVVETVKSTLNIRSACSIEFLAEGAFNKLYVIRSAENEVVARVTLPVDPKWKTLSEVATLRWVQQNTSLPVPEVLGFNANRANPVGFEWIVMTKVPGRPWADSWQEMSFAAKEQVVHRIALFCSDTFSHQMQGIGNLFPNLTPTRDSSLPEPGTEERATETNNSAAIGSPRHERLETGGSLSQNFGRMGAAAPSTPGFAIQRMVSSASIGIDVDPTLSRGPFATSREWLSARLDLTELDCSRRLNRVLGSDPVDVRKATDNSNTAMIETGTPNNGEDNEKNEETDDSTDDEDEDEDEDDDPEDLENALKIIAKLRAQLPNFFPSGGPEKEPSVIFHDDMNRHNILVDEAGALTAVVDWECVSALPLYAACQYPPFLQGKPLDVEPIKSKYQHDENGNVAELYWEHLEDYELTQLRRLFLAEMQKLQPGWVSIFNSSQRQRDFDLAVSSCDDPFMIRRIMGWLSDLESGAEGFQGLEERIDSSSM